jgi:ferredoxin
MMIRVDEDLCVGNGQCVVVAPEVFDQRDEDGVSVVLVDRPDGRLAELADQAIRECPAAAIARLTDDG